MTKFVTTPNILWKIENFLDISKKSSPTVELAGVKFQLTYSKFLEVNYEKIHLKLECQNYPQALQSSHINIDACIVYKNFAGNLPKSGKYSLRHNEFCVWSELVSNVRQILGDLKQITFLITVTPNEDLERPSIAQEFAEETSACVVSLSEDLGVLFDNAEHSDFTLTCKKRSFSVHKAILAARSHFFEAMFRGDWKETKERSGNIEDIEPDILELVLRYVYRGKMPQLSMDSLSEVYNAADRFIMEPLAMKCHALLMEKFTKDPEEDFENGAEGERSGSVKAVEKKSLDAKQTQILQDLFRSREWRLFAIEFPYEAREMCKLFLQGL